MGAISRYGPAEGAEGRDQQVRRRGAESPRRRERAPPPRPEGCLGGARRSTGDRAARQAGPRVTWFLLVERERDVVVGPLRRGLDARAVGEDPGQHRAEDVAVLDVDPVLRGRDEPAPLRSALVDAVAEEAGRVRDVPLRLQALLTGGAGEDPDPVGRERLVARAGRNGE